MGLLDNLGALSPGDGYANTPTSSDGSQWTGLLAALLGPTQSQQKMTDAAKQVNPQIVEASPQDAATAQMMGAGTGAPQGFGAPAAQTTDASADPAPTIQAPQVTPNLFNNVASPGPTGPVNMPIAQPTTPPDVSVAPNGTASDGQGADPTGGLLGSLQQAAQTPEESHGLLQSFADKAKMLGSKLGNLSPNASQALLATGLTMLAGNDGRHNLGQLVGEGGIAGINNYQSNVNVQAQQRLAQAKLAQESILKNQQQALEAWKAQHTVVPIAPGDSFTTAGDNAAGLPPQNSGAAVKEYVKVQDANGVEYNQAKGYHGEDIGAPTVIKDPYAGPLSDSERTAVNTYQAASDQGKQGLGRLQGYLAQLSPTMKDSQGNVVQNPNFVSVPGGLAASASDVWTRLTGDQTQAQQLRQQINQDVTKSSLASYKAGVGGRLTNADISMLQKGLPTQTGDGQALYTYLSKYATLKQNEQGHTEAQAAFAAVNRGSLGAVPKDTVINGQPVGKGTTFDQFANGQSAPVSRTSAPATGNPANVLMQVRAAARNGDVNAQAALKQRGISY